ncbi:hypothetical protein PANT_6d00041 [Moesziomyces antarcticus T-34]|uniref:Acid phosphatase n=1 Tax=Pseudozyma antarctica (strain T-34) TaxID=1151754 RepID=M9LTK2_PSEA3|nr:hypothetical protein PANT_6d00041 [Moesziomyces antarcticus T-34]
MSNVSVFPGVFNSSITPAGLPWDTYNYCNAPHVKAKHYTAAPEAKNATLVYVSVVQRHHKRTPDNLYPNENALNPASGWDCSNYQQVSYGVGARDAAGAQGHAMYRKIQNPTWHPLRSLLWNGTCDAGMLSADGLRDSIQHGKDFYSVYGPQGKNPLLRRGVNEEDVYIRTSNSDRTYQVAGGLLAGMGVQGDKFPVHTMPSNLDDIVPNYSCAYADTQRSAANSHPTWTSHLAGQADLFKQLNAVVGTANSSGWNSWIDHHFDAMASRQCHNHPLPTNTSTGVTISQDLANKAYAEGHWEYDWIWNSSPSADQYVRYGFGVFTQELARNLHMLKNGQDHRKLKYYIGHDGTMVRLYKTLALDGAFKWPALGSEIVFEVYKTTQGMYVRVLKDAKPIKTTAKDIADSQGYISWTPIEKLAAYLDARVPSDLYAKCVGGK